MSGSGKGGNNKRTSGTRTGGNRTSGTHTAGNRNSGGTRNTQRFSKQDRKKYNDDLLSDGKFEKNKISLHERPRWTEPVLPSENPITSPDCPWCGKQIKDITAAITDKDTGCPVHFDCVLARIGGMETLEKNDSICYIGGGRFGIVHYNNPPDTRDFTIKKIFEWELKDTSNEWRRPISEYFSLT